MKQLLLAMGLSLWSLDHSPQAPDKIYGALFVDVEMQRVFPDSKTFADAIPKRVPGGLPREPGAILGDYQKAKGQAGFNLRQFVAENFELSPQVVNTYRSDKEGSVKDHINQLWTVLQRASDSAVEGSSLLPLPHPYIVPGGRFHEIYYWDAYFTMLGLRESGREDMIQNMVDNFIFMLGQYGHIPNGNRTYYLSRSQPPFFSLMLDLLAEKQGASVYARYLSALQQEYD